MEDEGYENDGMYDWLIPSDAHNMSRLPKYCIHENGKLLYGLDTPALRPFTEYMLLDGEDMCLV